VVDSHLHVWQASEEAVSPVRVLVPPQTDVPIEFAWETFEQHGVERGVLVQPAFRGEDHQYIADCISRWPDRFAGVCAVDPARPDADVRLRDWVARGFRGLRLRPKFASEANLFGDSATFALWQAAQEMRVTVSVLADPQHLPRLATLAQQFPEVRIVVDHLGHPDVIAGAADASFRQLLDLADLGNVWVKLSGYYHFSRNRFPYPDCHELIRAIYDRFGPARLLWGSDFPHALLSCGYPRALLLPMLALNRVSDSERDAILADNAVELYW